MEGYRSISYSNSNEMSNTNGNSNENGTRTISNPPGMQDLRCYSASYASSSVQNNGQMDTVPEDGGGGEQWRFKKGKSTNGVVSKSWSFNDPEIQRKKRVASYKVYSVEGKVKGSFKKSFRWIKERAATAGIRQARAFLGFMETGAFHTASFDPNRVLLSVAPPAHSFLKLNCDATFFRTENLTGVGLVLRDDRGDLVSARTVVVDGVMEVHEGEACGRWVLALDLSTVALDRLQNGY